jgi:hypothetical protein
MESIKEYIDVKMAECCNISHLLVEKGHTCYKAADNTHGALVSLIKCKQILNRHYNMGLSYVPRDALELLDYTPVMQMINLYNPMEMVVVLIIIKITNRKNPESHDSYMRVQTISKYSYMSVSPYYRSVDGNINEECKYTSLSVCGSCAESKEKGSKLCARCRCISYCSRTCQLQDWKMHKPNCKEFALVKKNAKRILREKDRQRK